MNKVEETLWFKNQRRANGGRTPKHLMFATSLTRIGERNMENRKPFRNKAGRAVARANAEIKEGRFVSWGGFYGVRPQPRAA